MRRHQRLSALEQEALTHAAFAARRYWDSGGLPIKTNSLPLSSMFISDQSKLKALINAL